MCGQCRSLASRTHRTKRFRYANCVISRSWEGPGQYNVMNGVQLLERIALELIRNACASFGASSCARWLHSTMRCPTASASHLHPTRMCHPNIDSHKYFFCIDAAICSNIGGGRRIEINNQNDAHIGLEL